MSRRTNISLNSPSPLSTTPAGQSEPGSPVASTSTLPPPPPPAPSSLLDEAESLSSSAPIKRKLRALKDPSTPKRAKPSASSGVSSQHAPPLTRLADLGGVDKCIESMLELVALPICHPEVYLHTGVRPPRGVLLVGPPGCGKTMLAGAIAGVRLLLAFTGSNGADDGGPGARVPIYLHLGAVDRLGHVGRVGEDAQGDVRGGGQARSLHPLHRRN